MPLDRIAARLRQRIPATSLAAFLSCFLSGYLIHLFAFTNLIPNSDGLSRVFDPQQMTVSGRWFLHYASTLNGFTQMPALIGFLSMVFLSLAAAAAVLILGLHSRTLSALAGVLMAAFPCLGYTFLYYTREALGEVAPRIADFAEREGLHAHARSVTIRYEK